MFNLTNKMKKILTSLIEEEIVNALDINTSYNSHYLLVRGKLVR